MTDEKTKTAATKAPAKTKTAATKAPAKTKTAATKTETLDAIDAPDAELIAQRSPDIDAEAANEHIKVFVLEPGPKPTEENGFDHSANIAAARQYMISQGLRPAGDARVVSVKPYGPGGLSWAITYAIPAIPTENADPAAEVHVNPATEPTA